MPFVWIERKDWIEEVAFYVCTPSFLFLTCNDDDSDGIGDGDDDDYWQMVWFDRFIVG